MTKPSNLPFIVIGGGIGGLTAAVALARKGFPVHLLEQAPEFGEVGAGIQLGPNVFRALSRLDLRDAVLADAWQPSGLVMRCGLSGKEIARIPLGEQFRTRFRETYAVTHRADIHGTILQAARSLPNIKLETSRTVKGYEDNGQMVRVTIEGGATIDGRALVGCDGLWSGVRAKIVGDGKPRVSGHIAFRAVLKHADVPEELWQPDMVLWAGPRTHLVHYPLRRGDLYNLVAVFHSDRYEEGWNAEGSLKELITHFEGQRPEVLTLLNKIEAWRMWVLCDREPVKNWTKGRATLLGDAAHPMLQYLAQGACMAIEDAIVLADAIAESPGDIEAAFTAYNTARYLRTARVQIMARVYGAFYHAAGPTAELRDIFLASRSTEQAYESSDWLYGGGV